MIDGHLLEPVWGRFQTSGRIDASTSTTTVSGRFRDPSLFDGYVTNLSERRPGGSGFKRVSTGMGLSAMPTNGSGNTNATVKREPLGNLFVASEDGRSGGPDPKRVKR